MTLRRSTVFLGITVMNMLLLALASLHASRSNQQSTLADNRVLARKLQMTDLCLFTEARYTRHPAMADNHAPFQEHPSALDHFPSGSLLQPTRPHAQIH
jgi:hypothetical protein